MFCAAVDSSERSVGHQPLCDPWSVSRGRFMVAAVIALAVAAGCTSGSNTAGQGGTGTSVAATTAAPPTAAAPMTTLATSKVIALPVGLYIGTIEVVSPSSDQMTFKVTSSCGTPSSGLYKIDLADATFDINSDPGTEMGQETTISKSDFFSLAAGKPPSSPTNGDFWKRWHILVSPSSPIEVSDGPYGSCHGAYSFLP